MFEGAGATHATTPPRLHAELRNTYLVANVLAQVLAAWLRLGRDGPSQKMLRGRLDSSPTGGTIDGLECMEYRHVPLEALRRILAEELCANRMVSAGCPRNTS